MRRHRSTLHPLDDGTFADHTENHGDCLSDYDFGLVSVFRDGGRSDCCGQPSYLLIRGPGHSRGIHALQGAFLVLR